MLYETQVRKAYHCGLDPSSVSQLPVSVQKDQGSKAAIAGEIIYISLSLYILARSLVWVVLSVTEDIHCFALLPEAAHNCLHPEF